MQIKSGTLLVLAAIAAIIIAMFGILGFTRRPGGSGPYHSVQTIRRPCGRILRRTVESRGDTWIKTVELLDSSGMFVIRKASKVIEADVCNKIGRGIFVRGLWNDCSVD